MSSETDQLIGRIASCIDILEAAGSVRKAKPPNRASIAFGDDWKLYVIGEFRGRLRKLISDLEILKAEYEKFHKEKKS